MESVYQSYQDLMSTSHEEFGDKLDINYHIETDFGVQLKAIIASIKTQFIGFLVDDVIFYSTVNFDSSLEILEHDPSIFAIHPKLHPGITYSFTGQKPILTPMSYTLPSISMEGIG